ncbi:MAG: sugar phosphate isomerase/epimerase family protein [Phycisphaerae bacterium]
MTNARMLLSVSTLACPDWTLPQVVDACAAHGLHGIEFRGLGPEIDVTRAEAFVPAGPLDNTLALLAARGLRIPCYATSVTLVAPGPDRWQQMLDECHRYATLAQRTATPYLRIFGGAATGGLTDDEARATARRHVRQIVKVCKPRGVTPLLETHNAYTTADAMRELVHDLDPADVGVLWDVEHTTRAGESPTELARALAPWLRYVHLKDSRPDPTPHAPRQTRPCLIGDGDLPLPDVLAALASIRYDGWVCLETEKRWHPDVAPAPELSIPRFASFMRARAAAVA